MIESYILNSDAHPRNLKDIVKINIKISDLFIKKVSNSYLVLDVNTTNIFVLPKNLNMQPPNNSIWF